MQIVPDLAIAVIIAFHILAVYLVVSRRNKNGNR